MGKIAQKSRLSARVVKALGIFGSIQLITMICSVVRTKLVAVWIGTAGVGIISLYNATLDLIKFLASLDINQCAVPKIAKASATEKPAATYLVKRVSFVFGTAGSVATLTASPFLSKLTFGSYDYTWGFALLSPTVFCAVLSNALTAILQGLDRLRELAKAGLYGSLCATVAAIPMFYFMRYGAIVPVLIAYQLAAMIFLLIPHLEKPAVVPGRAELRRALGSYLKLGAGLTLGVATGMAADYLLRVYINSCASIETVGIFQAGATIIKSYVGILFTAICMEYFPRLSATIRRRRITSVVVSHEIAMSLWILMPVVVIFIAADRLIVTLLYSQSFMPVIPLIGIAIASTFFRAVSWCLSLVIVARGDSVRYILTEAVSGASLLVLGIAGWHLGGMAGIGAAIVGQFVVHALVTFLVCRRCYSLELSKSLPALLLMAVAVWGAAVGLKLWLGWWTPLVALLPWLIPITVKRLKIR